MPIDYETVGTFYETLPRNSQLRRACRREGGVLRRPQPADLAHEIDFQGCDPVICSITALKAFDAIVSQGEGAPKENADSHYRRFIAIREEFRRCARRIRPSSRRFRRP